MQNQNSSVSSSTEELTADLAVTITDSLDFASLGGELTYTLKVTNQGNVEATEVVLTDTLPPGVEFVSATTSNDFNTSYNSYIDPTFSVDGNVLGNNVSTLDFTLGTIPPNESASVELIIIPTIDSRTSSADPFWNYWHITNNAVVSTNSSQTDSNPDNNRASTVTEVYGPEVYVSGTPNFFVDEGDNGNTNFNFKVYFYPASTATVTVDYATDDKTAVAGEDYIAKSGSLTFAPGETEKTITVEVIGDKEIEPDETFRVDLTNYINALAWGTSARIQNDDIPPTLHVTNIQVKHDSLSIEFDRDINPNLLNLYQRKNDRDAIPDLTLVGEETGMVNGSLVWDRSTKTLTFIATTGILEPDNYTLTIPSREGGIVTPNGNILDGEGDGITGGDYSYEFTIQGNNDRIISIPDITLAQGEAIDIPISLDRVNGLARLQFDLSYNPDLLDITAVNPNESLPLDWHTTSEIDRDNGIVSVAIEGDSFLKNYNEYQSLDLVIIEAVVPDTASYGEAQILDLVNVYSNLDLLDDDGIHRVIKAGDVTGDGTISGLDAYQMMRISVGLDDGFDTFAAVDPLIAGDLNGDGFISAFDASYVLGNY